jgi:hypothetical protein
MDLRGGLIPPRVIRLDAMPGEIAQARSPGILLSGVVSGRRFLSAFDCIQ